MTSFGELAIFMCDASVDPTERWRAAILAMRPAMLSIAANVAPANAEDCVQEAMLRALDRVGQFRGETEGQLRAWVRMIVRRECLSQLRRRLDCELPAAASEPVEVERTASQRVRLREERARLSELLTKLTDAEQEAIFLRFFEGWTIEQIAGQMQRSGAAVGGLIRRGLARLSLTTSPSEWSQILQ